MLIMGNWGLERLAGVCGNSTFCSINLKQIKCTLKKLMYIVSSAYGMHSIFRQSYLNSLAYGRGKDIKIKGKALHPPAKVISV